MGGPRSPDTAVPASLAETVRARLGGPEYATLFQALRRRLEESWPEPVRSLVLAELTVAERTALSDLHGWETVPDGPIRVRFDKLDEALRASRFGLGALEVVEALGGPIVPRRPARAAALEERERLWADARAHPSLLTRPQLETWLHALREHGLLARVAPEMSEQRRLLAQALDVVARLPANNTLLSVLAAEATGDPHALDPGAPLTTIVLRAVTLMAGWPAVPSTAPARRRLWLEVGVLCDPLSADVLVLGLRPAGDRLARHLCESSDDGEPRRITLRELTRSSFAVPPGTEVSICENPGVVNAAADQLGARSAPLICVEGVPSTAGLELIGRLRRDGARLRFHGDFDWWGIRIGNVLAANGAQPWRFGTKEYVRAMSACPHDVPLGEDVVSASWDPELRTEMHRVGYAVFEEQVMAELLEDLHAT